MDKILTALGGVALGVAAYTLGELVQEKRAEKGQDYGILDLLDEFFDDTSKSESQAKEQEA